MTSDKENALVEKIKLLDLSDEVIAGLLDFDAKALKIEINNMVKPLTKACFVETIWPRRIIEYIRRKYGVSIYGRLNDKRFDLSDTERMRITIYVLSTVARVSCMEFVKEPWGTEDIYQKSISYVKKRWKADIEFANHIFELSNMVYQDLKK